MQTSFSRELLFTAFTDSIPIMSTKFILVVSNAVVNQLKFLYFLTHRSFKQISTAIHLNQYIRLCTFRLRIYGVTTLTRYPKNYVQLTVNQLMFTIFSIQKHIKKTSIAMQSCNELLSELYFKI